MKECPNGYDRRMFAANRIMRTGGFIDLNNLITHPKPGLKVWSAIDCLCNYYNCIWGGQSAKGSKRASKRKGKSFNRR